jgi:tRNA A37 N6-isopentenylltransferase MiaA
VETILIENLIMPLQKTIEIDGDGYVLVGGTQFFVLKLRYSLRDTEKKEWVYGRRLSLKWGDEEVRACADKWVFYFHPCRPGSRTGTTAEA